MFGSLCESGEPENLREYVCVWVWVTLGGDMSAWFIGKMTLRVPPPDTAGPLVVSVILWGGNPSTSEGCQNQTLGL